MHINIDGPSSDNFDTEKFVSDWIESAVTSRHLNDHNSFRTEIHDEADEKLFVLKWQNKIKTLLDYFICIYCFFLTFIMRDYFLALVDMNYLIFIRSVDNTIEANYRIMLYYFLQKLFFFAVFIFSINRKTTNDFKK